MKKSVPIALAALSIGSIHAQTPGGSGDSSSSTPSTVHRPPSTASAFAADPNPPSFYAAPPSSYTPAVPDGIDPALSFPERLLENPFQWGPFRLFPFITYAYTYTDGLLASPGQPADSASHTLTPGLRLASKHLTFSYTPSFSFYTKGPYDDSINHTASAALNFGYGDWTFGLSHGYSVGSQVLVETARQTDTESHGTSLSAGYRVSDRTSLQFTVSQSISDTSGFNDSKTWSTMNWLNYAITDRTQVGIGAGGGYSDVDAGSDMTYEELQGRVTWRPRPKIDFSLNGGIEVRQFLGEEASDDAVNPIFGVAATYRPFETTSLTFSANRGVAASLFADQITETTSASLALAQRFLERFQGSLAAGVSFIDYQGTSRVRQSVFEGRNDDVVFVSAGLSTAIFKKGSASASYTHSQNSSSLQEYTYDSNTISLQLGYHF